MKKEIELDIIAKEILNLLSKKDLSIVEADIVLDRTRGIMMSQVKINYPQNKSIEEVTVYNKSDKSLITKIFKDEEGIKGITSNEYEVVVETKDSQEREPNDYGCSSNPMTKKEWMSQPKMEKPIK